MSVQADIDRGLQIRFELERLEAELKKIETRLEIAGLKGEQVPLSDGDREGRQYIARGTGQQVPIIFTADQIISGFVNNSSKHMQLRDLVGDALKEFFKLTWSNRTKDGKAFRAKARDRLGDKAPHFITTVWPVTRMAWPRTRP